MENPDCDRSRDLRNDDLKRGGERPAFPKPGPGAPPLEGEAVCLCAHAEGVHDVFGACTAGRRTSAPCDCEQFEAAAEPSTPEAS